MSGLILPDQYTDAVNIQVAYQPGPGAKPVYALEGSSKLTSHLYLEQLKLRIASSSFCGGKCCEVAP